MKAEEFLTRLDNGDKFSVRELEHILWVLGGASHVDEEREDLGRMRQAVKTIFRIDDRYFSLAWMHGYTEFRNNDFCNQPIEVTKKQYEKITTVTKWEPVDKEEK